MVGKMTFGTENAKIEQYPSAFSIGEDRKISAFVGENTDNFIYIIDPDTYDMIYMNKKALTMYGNPTPREIMSKKCYELLHDKTQPCEFCTNKFTTEYEFYEWKYYHPEFKRTYLFKDKLVPLNGKLMKLQVATDITKLVDLEKEITNKLEEQNLLLGCIKMLHTGDTPDASIEKILGIVGEFFEATRCVIMQISENGDAVSNTHEWINGEVSSRKHTLQNIPMSVVKPFFDRYTGDAALYTTEILNLFITSEQGFAIFKDREVESIISSPILNMDGEYIGLCGVDNPKKNMDKHGLLGSLSVFIADFLEKNKLFDSLNELSYYDTLTGIKNRQSYRKALKEIDEHEVSSLGVAYVDISELSKTNEEKGTRYGDEIIKKMAKILKELFMENAFRVGGNEFVVMETNIAELDFEKKISELKDIINSEPELNAVVGYTWNSGFGTWDDEDDEDDEDDDEYNTVRDSRNYTAILSKNLDKEIKSGKYVIFLQPQINFKTGELDGAEALIRRIDANGNTQSPISFVPFYEKEGMISKIDFYVFDTVCALVKDWKERLIDDKIKFSINFSRLTVMEKNLVSKLSAICEKHQVEKSKFIVEITETISHSDDKVFSNIISMLREEGFCVSLDDFGSGYANLSALNASDFDEIKIDMGLTRNLHIDKKSKILTKVALNLCDEFENMVSVAEGIETKEQYDILKNLNCDKGQGYYFSKPISTKDFEQKYLANC